MRKWIASACLGLCLTGVAAAAPSPEETPPEGEVSCVLFPPTEIRPGESFDLRVSRVPGYPGGWFAPTVRFKVVYPTWPGWEYVQGDQRTIGEMGVIRVDATLLAPFSLYSDPDGGFVPGGTVNIVAFIREPSGARTRCAAATTIAF